MGVDARWALSSCQEIGGGVMGYFGSVGPAAALEGRRA